MTYQSSYSGASLRAKVWNSQWYACTDGNSTSPNGNWCEDAFQSIYNSNLDTISITRDYSVDRYGGLQANSCSFSSNFSSTFTCYKWNSSYAQGYTSSFIGSLNSNGSSGSINPLPFSFLVFNIYNSSAYRTEEWRYWLQSDTGYSSNVLARRPFGSNARGGLTWDYSTSVYAQY